MAGTAAALPAKGSISSLTYGGMAEASPAISAAAKNAAVRIIFLPAALMSSAGTDKRTAN